MGPEIEKFRQHQSARNEDYLVVGGPAMQGGTIAREKEIGRETGALMEEILCLATLVNTLENEFKSVLLPSIEEKPVQDIISPSMSTALGAQLVEMRRTVYRTRLVVQDILERSEA